MQFLTILIISVGVAIWWYGTHADQPTDPGRMDSDGKWHPPGE